MKNVVGLIFRNSLKAAVTMALVACAGQSSDPLKDYKDVKLVPKHDKESPDQTASVHMFRILVSRTNEKTYGNFVVGKSGSVEIKLEKLSDKTPIQDSSIDISGFAGNNQPVKKKLSKDTWLLTWKPDANSQERIEFTVTAKAIINGKETDGHSKELVFNTSRNVKDPQVKSVTGLNVNAVEGKNIQFSVVVNDPNYMDVGAPQVFFPPVQYNNTEAFMASAHKLVDENSKLKPVHEGGGNFRFFYIMDLSKLPQDIDRKGNVDPNAAKVQLCLNIGVASVAGRNSGIVQECLDAKYSAQPPKIELLSANRKVKAGEANSIEVKISNSDGQSKVSLAKPESQIGNLAGAKSVAITASDANSETYTITWTPVCNSKANNQKSSLLRLIAKATLNNASKDSLPLAEQFEIDNSGCEAIAKAKADAELKAKEEAAAAKKAEADKKAAELEAQKKVASEKAAADAAAKKKAQEEKAAAAQAKAEADKLAQEAKKAQSKTEQPKPSTGKKS